MKVIQKAIHIIDYENSSVISRDIPAEFESYVTDLINHISENDSVREYKTRSNSTEVISCVISICNNLSDDDTVLSKMETIAKRLLLKETEAQEREKEAHGYKKGSYTSCGPSRDSSYCYVFVFPYREALSRQDKPRFSR